MRIVQIQDAKAEFSALVDAAEQGEPTTITRCGRPAAVLVPLDAARHLYPDEKPSFVEFLLGFPGPLETDRDVTPLRPVDLA